MLNVGELTKCYVKWKKPHTKDHILCDPRYMKNLKINDKHRVQTGGCQGLGKENEEKLLNWEGDVLGRDGSVLGLDREGGCTKLWMY